MKDKASPPLMDECKKLQYRITFLYDLWNRWLIDGEMNATIHVQNEYDKVARVQRIIHTFYGSSKASHPMRTDDYDRWEHIIKSYDTHCLHVQPYKEEIENIPEKLKSIDQRLKGIPANNSLPGDTSQYLRS